VLDRVPTENEWRAIRSSVAEAHQAESEAIVGPQIDADGHPIFRFYVPVRGERGPGVLVAVFDARDMLESLLLDQAPGYEIAVSCCDGVELYRRGTSTAEVPTAWVRAGRIAPAPGVLWSIEHRPSAALTADLGTRAIDSVLLVGLALSLLLGALLYERGRADDRAAAATAAEHAVRAMNRDLENRVAARTKDLDDVLGDLNTINLSVSHDLRSPLNAIALLAHRLRDADRGDGNAEVLAERVLANVQRMTSIMDRLHGFSRASSFQYRIERVDMRSLAEQVVREQTAGAPVCPTIEVGDLPPTDADPAMIHVVLTNLIANALKYAARATGEIEIEVGWCDHDGEIAYFVRDDGPGFDEGIATELFKPMLRRPQTGSDGMGLGLAIAARVVARHDGEIWARSAPGQGATFYFTLRRRGAARAPADDRRSGIDFAL
jgi:signal transduction histidine kinase